ncbi:pentatricopeptide repeat-containing protein [Tripterygium wilfordii]|uniref:Pentatricopeptide repeat-containing protein n=1 Tax=Tripterygium wilfordii TaxID=458696 RepID=A0A7J7DNJ9_TRIWF|nr:pentatricopeptide repeat-containing protein At1g80270, mitochondrial-like [Tripterygium wilfordii]XP_038701360.1 pentatricopeptide repeat-containing protein At1g80270, mitochondrial-like [Tripterygium wilfordii]KAF5747932.1 pentatricopeptide repeat-containing protein [Tripterygium wilfordii]
MWALRRASNPLRYRGLSGGISRACYSKSEILSGNGDFQVIDVIAEFPQGASAIFQMCNADYVPSNFSFGRRALSSQAGAESSESERDSEEGFSEIEAPATADATKDEGEVISEPELSDDENNEEPSQNELELLDTEAELGEKAASRKKEGLELVKDIIAAPGLSVKTALDKWQEEGKYLGREVIAIAILNLRKRRMYGRALQLSEWLESNKRLECTERNYASHLDLIAKVHGIQKAERYVSKIPQSFRGEVIYRTLLANCVSDSNVKKAEEVFNKMKDLGLTITSFTYNQLLLLYKRVDKKKIADVLLLMEKENIKPTRFTYRILIDTKGKANDIDGMAQIVETMKAQGIEPDVHIQAVLAKHYVYGGLKEKAEAILKEMEGSNLKEHRLTCRALLPLYAALGKADEVERVWKACESDPRLDECMAAIEAWGMLKKIDEAEAVFERMSKKYKKLSSRQYSSLLKVYANHKMLTKGKDLIKRMADSGCRIGPFIWDALVKLYVDAGEVEKADSVLQKAMQQIQMKPLFNSYIVIMNQYAKRGDIHNTEKMFHMIRQAGYASRVIMFGALMQAYTNAKAPAYGMWDRMRADNIFPNKGLAAQLDQVNAFRKTPVSDLLD